MLWKPAFIAGIVKSGIRSSFPSQSVAISSAKNIVIQAVIQQATSSLSDLTREPASLSSLPNDKTLYLLDGTAMLYRAFYSKIILEDFDIRIDRPLILMGLQLGNFLKTHEPRYIAVTFDYVGSRAENIRREFYPGYKANRPEQPQEFRDLVPHAINLMQALGVRTMQADGFEADDLMATVAKWSSRRSLTTVLVSEDKDLFAVASKDVFVLHPRTLVLYGPEEVEGKCGVRPSQNRDLIGLMGDLVDGIPGVKGVGKKTAVTLLKHFGSLEGIFENIDLVPTLPIRGAKSLKDKLLSQEKEAFLYREVATLYADLDLPDLRGRTVRDFRFRGVDASSEDLLRSLGLTGPLLYIKKNVRFDYY